MPKNECISETLARAIMSEVCHGHPMNWAQYASERWRVKRNRKKKESMIKYGGKESKNSYYQLVKAKVEGELAKSELQHSEIDAEYSDRHVFISMLMSSPKNPASGAEEERIKIWISRLRGQLQVSEGNLKNIVESAQDVEENIKEEDKIVNLKYRIKGNEIAFIGTKGEIFIALICFVCITSTASNCICNFNKTYECRL
ncbi:hypothetical protein KC19_9G072800 [Ceratodon purpureus]|uniref:Uncharacterized protein n=1 Tax=Ceratodon purpureus TaxID=3225 RepID=A0A8T0GTR7_CERPU|nr:hypothetical protein KC19_9G072800 [Ceratodon purpureus]